MLPPICLIPPVPHCTLRKGYQSSSRQGTEVLSIKIQYDTANLYWHITLASFTCNNGPLNSNDRPPLEKRIQYQPFPFQLGLSFEAWGLYILLRRWPFNLRLRSHSRKDRYGELHLILGIINSPTLRSSWTKCLQRREKGRPLIKCSDSGMWQCSGGLAWLYRNGGHSEVPTGVHGEQVLGFAKIWEECSFPSQVWHAVKGPSL